MRVTYRLSMECSCPTDGLKDHYIVEVIANRVIEVEEILELVQAQEKKQQFQETLTETLSRQLNTQVITRGTHYQVEVICQCGGPLLT